MGNIKMFAQKLLPALAVFSVAAAQTSTICSQPTVTVNSQADASQLSDCSTVSGTIVIDGPQQVRGNLTSQSAGGLVSLTSSTITSIGGEFRLFNLTSLQGRQCHHQQHLLDHSQRYQLEHRWHPAD